MEVKKLGNLSEREEKYNVIQKVINGEYTKEKAIELLGLGIRQINRLIIKYIRKKVKMVLYTKLKEKRTKEKLLLS